MVFFLLRWDKRFSIKTENFPVFPCVTAIFWIQTLRYAHGGKFLRLLSDGKHIETSLGQLIQYKVRFCSLAVSVWGRFLEFLIIVLGLI